MIRTAMLENILNQPASLRRVIGHQLGDGYAEIRAAAEAIREAGKVAFVGMGSSLSAAIPAAYYLNSHGIEAEVVEASEALHFGKATAGKGVTVLVSRSGETVEIARLLEHSRFPSGVTIGLTNVRDSLLARRSRHAIFLNSDDDRMVAVQTYTGTMATLLLLAALALGEEVEEWRSAMETAADALSQAIDQAIAASEEWNEFLHGAGVVYLLGRGPSLASVREGALLFNEAARTPAVAMSAAHFRHGPVEVVDARFRGIVFTSQQATRELDMALASDLTSMGAEVRICRSEGVRTPLEPVVEIVPVQVAACRLAEAKGIDPGDFRFATLVTSAEAGFKPA